jgi:hypothetical protein
MIDNRTMTKGIFALALALSVLPITALAQDANASQAPTDAQRQAMHQTMERFAQQAEQLHEQMRAQILAILTPVHRRAVAAEVGNLVISPNPDVDATVKRIDAILSPGEQQRIIQAHAAFFAAAKQLHAQLKAQMQSEMPAGHPSMPAHPMNDQMKGQMEQRMHDAGWIVLHALPPHAAMEGMREMMGHMWGDHGDHTESGPPPP